MSAYGEAALDSECSAIAATTGGRNAALNSASFLIGRLVGGGELDRQTAEQRLFAAAETSGYVKKDGAGAARATIKSGLDQGQLEPREAPRNNGAAHRTTEALPKRRAAPLPAAVDDGAVPTWTVPDEKGWPRLESIGDSEPPAVRDELPDRRHLYRRDGEAVRAKIKRRSGGFLDIYRVRRPDTGEIGWQAKKPAGFEPVPYVGSINPFDPALSGDTIFVPEGEKDVDTLAASGLAAFSFGGSSDRPAGCEKWIVGRDVVILADNDDQGRDHAQKLAAIFATVASSVKIVEFPELPVKADVSDWIAGHGGTVKELWRRVDSAPRIPMPDVRAEIIKATPFVWINPAYIPRRQWLYGRHYVRKFISETIAPGAYGKSSLAIVEALAIVTGRPLLGVTPDERTNVWIWNGEDPAEELQRRFTAAMLHYRIDPTEIEGRLFVDTGRKTRIVIAEQTKSGAIVARPVVDAVIATIKANSIGLFIVDPFVASHHVVENDNPAIELVAGAWAEIADVTGCAIELVHHARKTGGAEITVDDGRGGSALLAKVRSARVLNGMSDAEAKNAGVENRRPFFRVQNGKANLTAASDQADWRQLVSVELANGDSVGVVTGWKWPDAFENVTVSHLRAVQVAVAAKPWRHNPQASDWVGHAVASVMGLNVAKKADKAKISALLKTWTAKGMFIVVEGEDEKRNTRKFVEVGTPAND